MILPASEADPDYEGYEDVEITDHEGGRVTLYIVNMLYDHAATSFNRSTS